MEDARFKFGHVHMWMRRLRLADSPILQEYATFKSRAKGLTGGSERIRVGCEDLIVSRGLAVLVGWLLVGAASFPM